MGTNSNLIHVVEKNEEKFHQSYILQQEILCSQQARLLFPKTTCPGVWLEHTVTDQVFNYQNCIKCLLGVKYCARHQDKILKKKRYRPSVR